MRSAVAVAGCVALLAAGFALGQETSVKSLPPSVVRTVPQTGDTAVDASSTRQITVTFSKDMKDGSWSWANLSKETAPVIVGKPKYLDDKRTCVLEVSLSRRRPMFSG